VRIPRKVKLKSFYRFILVIFGITVITTALASEKKAQLYNRLINYLSQAADKTRHSPYQIFKIAE